MAQVLNSKNETTRPVPLYQQIRADLLNRIARSEYPTGAALPSENELAKLYDTTRLTIRSALEGLVQQGILRRIQGKGTFVSNLSGGRAGESSSLSGFRNSMRKRGHTPSVRIIEKSTRLAGQYYADLFDIEPTDALYSIRRLNSIDAIPATIEQALIPLTVFPTIESIDITAFSLYETYGILGHPVCEAHQKLSITRLDVHNAKLLCTDADSPALVLECLTVDESGQIIEYARSINCGTRAGFSYQF
ncbi:GntR family transcriptional regulator [Collinsella sp. AGMB00827]|uniref:GntR family transcriptional regulator n=1 Tax=Collinsella ureilytica TaxID=2869515 RepID=A0ABS7MKG2_9ACTN|nr:GntR family transcriptional regulator [Collinsella urealyticum]MBY4797864.1 GntR family transcriptional regulator [Collinsella urealyticum]